MVIKDICTGQSHTVPNMLAEYLNTDIAIMPKTHNTKRTSLQIALAKSILLRNQVLTETKAATLEDAIKILQDS